MSLERSHRYGHNLPIVLVHRGASSDATMCKVSFAILELLVDMSSNYKRRVLPNVILELRTQRGWTQKRLAKEAGVSRRTIANLEAALGNFAPLTICDVARALDVSGDSLTLQAEKERPTGEEMRNQIEINSGPVILMLVLKGSRVEINEMLPMYDLGKIISRMIDEGKLIPLAISDGSIVLKAKMYSFTAVELINHFAKGLMARWNLIRIGVPMKHAYLVPQSPTEVTLAEQKIEGKPGFGFVVPYKLTLQLSEIAQAVSTHRLQRHVTVEGDVILSRGQSRTSIKHSLTPP